MNLTAIPPDALNRFRHAASLQTQDANSRASRLLILKEEIATLRLESDIKDSLKRGTELEAKVGSPFEKEDRYHHLVKRQSEIEEQLDLTKNQAPSQVDAAGTDEREEFSEKQIEKQPEHKTRRTTVRV